MGQVSRQLSRKSGICTTGDKKSGSHNLSKAGVDDLVHFQVAEGMRMSSVILFRHFRNYVEAWWPDKVATKPGHTSSSPVPATNWDPLETHRYASYRVQFNHHLIRDTKPVVRRVQPHSPPMPMSEPIPKVALKIDRKRTAMKAKTSDTTENDALMQYLLRPISTLSCFVSDAQNMAQAPGFGTSLLRSQGVLPSNWSPLQTGTAFICSAHIHVGLSASLGSWWVYGNQILAKSALLRVSCYPSIKPSPQTKQNDADSG